MGDSISSNGQISAWTSLLPQKSSLLLLGMMMVIGCRGAEQAVGPGKAQPAPIHFRVAAPFPGFAKVAVRAKVTVSHPEITRVSAPLEISDSALEARLDGVPSGEERRFEVFVYDSTNALAYYGDESLDVGESGEVQVSIALARVGTIRIDGEFSGAMD